MHTILKRIMSLWVRCIMGWIERELVPRATPHRGGVTSRINSGYYMVVRRYEISLQHEKRNFVSVKRPYVLPGAGSNYQSGPQPELDIWWRHPNFQHGAQTKGHDPGSLFSSLLHLEMTFSHSTLGVVPLNDEEALECEKNATDEVCVFSRGKTAENGSVSAQRSTWQGAKHLKIERCASFFWSLKKRFLKSS